MCLRGDCVWLTFRFPGEGFLSFPLAGDSPEYVGKLLILGCCIGFDSLQDRTAVQAGVGFESRSIHRFDIGGKVCKAMERKVVDDGRMP